MLTSAYIRRYIVEVDVVTHLEKNKFREEPKKEKIEENLGFLNIDTLLELVLTAHGEVCQYCPKRTVCKHSPRLNAVKLQLLNEFKAFPVQKKLFLLGITVNKFGNELDAAIHNFMKYELDAHQRAELEANIERYKTEQRLIDMLRNAGLGA